MLTTVPFGRCLSLNESKLSKNHPEMANSRSTDSGATNSCRKTHTRRFVVVVSSELAAEAAEANVSESFTTYKSSYKS